MLVYRHALHPEFFDIEGRQRIRHGEYEFEAWIFKGGHAVRFEHNGLCVTEVVTDLLDHLPDRGLVTTLPCAGEKDHEGDFGDQVSYITSMQTETITEHLYLGTCAELQEHAANTRCPVTAWADELGKPNMAMIDIQRFADQVHLQGYHLRSDCGLVLRTQSIFQVKSEEPVLA
jgi:hypothetical protein